MSGPLVPIPLPTGDIHIDVDHVSTVYVGASKDTVLRYKDGDYQLIPGDVVAEVVQVVNSTRTSRAGSVVTPPQYPHPGKDT